MNIIDESIYDIHYNPMLLPGENLTVNFHSTKSFCLLTCAGKPSELIHESCF